MSFKNDPEFKRMLDRPRTLKRDHIENVLKGSPATHYAPEPSKTEPSSRQELRDSARWAGQCVETLLRAIDPPSDAVDYGPNPGVAGSIRALEMAVESLKRKTSRAPLKAWPDPTPERPIGDGGSDLVQTGPFKPVSGIALSRR